MNELVSMKPVFFLFMNWPCFFRKRNSLNPRFLGKGVYVFILFFIIGQIICVCNFSILPWIPWKPERVFTTLAFRLSNIGRHSQIEKTLFPKVNSVTLCFFSISFIVFLSLLNVGRSVGCSSQHFNISWYLDHTKKVTMASIVKRNCPSLRMITLFGE